MYSAATPRDLPRGCFFLIFPSGGILLLPPAGDSLRRGGALPPPAVLSPSLVREGGAKRREGSQASSARFIWGGYCASERPTFAYGGKSRQKHRLRGKGFRFPFPLKYPPSLKRLKRGGLRSPSLGFFPLGDAPISGDSLPRATTQGRPYERCVGRGALTLPPHLALPCQGGWREAPGG